MSVTGLGRIATAEKMSVNQLQEALENKTLPAYIAVPLLEEKMDMNSRMQAMAAMQQAQQPRIPIGQRVMQRAAAESGIDQLPSNLPVVRGAGGGIVAFEDGGEVIHAQDGLYVNPYLANYIRQMETGGLRDPDAAVSPKGARGIMQIMPATAMKPGFGVPTIFDLADQAGIEYKGRTEDEAKRLLTNRNLNIAFGERYAGAMQKKFGDNPVLAAAAYNAGPGAVERAGGVPNIAETQKYVAGISPERFAQASESVRGARREQLQDLSKGIKEALPSVSGIAGINAPIPIAGEGATQEERDRAAILGTMGKFNAAAADVATLIPRAFTGVANTGIIRPLRAITGYNIPYAKDIFAPEGSDITSMTPFTDRYVRTAQAAPAAKERDLGLQRQYEAQDIQEGEAGRALSKPVALPTALAAAPEAKPEEDSDIAALRKSIAARRGELGKQREQDKYMALLAAGLGMMGGTSRYAAENIGKGALQGVASMQAARREQREAEQDVLASELGLSRATLYEKMRLDQIKSNKDIAAAKNAISQQLADLKQQQGYRDAVDMWENSAARGALEKDVAKRYGKNWQQDDKAKLELQMARNRYIQELLRGGRTAGIPTYSQMMGQ
jgi:hypothetical protein